MVAGFAAVLGKQARHTVLFEAAQQTKHLAPLQPNQRTGVTHTQTTRLNPQQHLKTAELLLAHRQHRQGAPPGTPEPGGSVTSTLHRGVISILRLQRVSLSVRHLGRSMNGLRAGMSAAPLMAAARVAAGVTSLTCQKRASILDCCSAGNTSG